MNLLAIEGLSVVFETRTGPVTAVDSIDLVLEENGKTALIGESGSGKTVLGLSVVRLLPPNARIGGSVRFGGRDLLCCSEREMESVRGKTIAFIPQNSPMALNPVMRVGDQIGEVLLYHACCPEEAVQETVVRLLGELGIDRPEESMRRYPHEFSGGMRERILVAMALACNPSLVIADEPTSGLDALVKTRIIALLQSVFRDRPLLLITHDLGTAAALTTETAVLYAGEIVEFGPTAEILSHPFHPYTQGLIASVPSSGFHPIPGMSPAPGAVPPGCRFSPRCFCATARCHTEHPALQATRSSRKVRCHRYD